jgi:RND superfamily putative drug exporter
VLAALATVTGAFGTLLAFSLFVKYDNTVLSVVTILGLGLSIDYGLLLVARFREELARSHDRVAAVRRTWATAGRTIMFSGLTIVVALIGLLMFDVPRLRAMGAAGISAALIAMLTALTLTGALLGLFGRWIKPSRRAQARYAAAAQNHTDPDDVERGLFARLARVTQKRPMVVVVGTTLVLLFAASPLLGLTVRLPQSEGLPRSMSAMRVADELHADYGQIIDPAVQVVARTSPAELDSWAKRWLADQEVTGVESAVAAGPNLSSVVFAVRGEPQSGEVTALVTRVRTDRPAGVRSWVTGEAAVLADLNSRVAAGLPLAVVVTVVAMIVLLFLMTGSLVVPLTAIAMNLLSLGATFGVLTLVFQHGWLSGALGTLTVGGLSPTLIVSLAAFAFGFSMDYEVFLLGRIKEYADRGNPTAVAVRHGLQRSGRVITSAALLMLIVFACFGTAQLGDLQQVGIGLFVAVLVDATIVRCLLVPATMTVLGKRNWWAPKPLRRLHARFGLREGAPADRPDLAAAGRSNARVS